MQYMGGKAQIARHLVAAILADTPVRDIWYEPFVGGANVMEHAAPHFARSFGTDIHPDLIMLWRHVTAGGEIPETISYEEYRALRRAEPSWLRGLVGFGASFGGKWFGGYGVQKVDARHPHGHVYPGTRKVMMRQAAVFRHYDVTFACREFGVVPPIGSVVYCDPPYASTTGYSTGSFDYDYFYHTLCKWAVDRFVYVSEYEVPDDVPHRVIWQRDKRVALKAGDNRRLAVERLFRILP
jgi:DNA adenine methylase